MLYDLPFNMEMQKKMASSKKNVSNFAFIAKADFEKLNDNQKVAYEIGRAHV